MNAIADPVGYMERKFHITLKRKIGDEYVGPCPLSCGGHGTDRFHVWSDKGNYWCRQCGDQGFVDEFDKDWRPTPEEIAKQAEERARHAEESLRREIQRAERAIEELREAQSWLKYHESLLRHGRGVWNNRGVPDFWQDFWFLGYCEDFSLKRNENGQWVEWWHTPTLSIPIRDRDWQVTNIKHRLVNVPDIGGKYRYEKYGIPAQPFICSPDHKSGPLFLAEGEIKAMVVFTEITSNPNEETRIQVAGLPSVKPDPASLELFKDHEPIYLCLDPDAYDGEEAPIDTITETLGRERVRQLWLPSKIDDAIVAGDLDKDGLRRLIRTARKPR